VTALSLRSVSRRFGTVRAVERLSLEAAPGELVCLLGASGCGKSTVLRLIAGFEHPDEGDILIDGASALAIPPNRRATSMVFQSHALWPHMSVFDNIAFGLRLHHLQRKVIVAKVTEVLELVGLAGYERRYPRQLSGGQQQRVALARSLVLEPNILLLDEPFSSLDAHLRVRLRDELRSIQRRLALTSIFVTHDQEEAMTLADRIAVMNRGELEQVGPPGEIYDRPATLFVAGFIGQMNFLTARREGDIVRAGGLEFAVEGSRAGKAWTVALRPEDCDIVPATEPCGLRGTVSRIVDLGPVRVATVSLIDGTALKVQVARRGALEAAREVRVCVRRALVYRDGGSPTEIFPAPGSLLDMPAKRPEAISV
jgi:putative spermidine/putrescine transport system ATP-binding protein